MTSCKAEDIEGKIYRANTIANAYNTIVTYKMARRSVRPSLNGRPVEFTIKMVVVLTIE